MCLIVSIFIAENNLKLTTADCEEKCELSKLNRGHHETGVKNRAMLGHSFRNFTLSRIYECHVKCFDEKCRCQAFQISGNRCELLDEDRLSAPDDFVNKDGYAYFDMTREYVQKVRLLSVYFSKIISFVSSKSVDDALDRWKTIIGNKSISICDGILLFHYSRP